MHLHYKQYNQIILSINVCKLKQQIGVFCRSTRGAPKKHLHLRPYKITSVHEFKEREDKRVE
jgi:hypothetical protein